jgi:hypothetical protein
MPAEAQNRTEIGSMFNHCAGKRGRGRWWSVARLELDVFEMR